MKTAKYYKISLNEASNNLTYYSIINLVILSHISKVSRSFQDTKNITEKEYSLEFYLPE